MRVPCAGLTHGLKNYDSWMHDNECYEPGGGLEKAMKVLAKAWKDTLKKSGPFGMYRGLESMVYFATPTAAR